MVGELDPALVVPNDAHRLAHDRHAKLFEVDGGAFRDAGHFGHEHRAGGHHVAAHPVIAAEMVAAELAAQCLGFEAHPERSLGRGRMAIDRGHSPFGAGQRRRRGDRRAGRQQ